MLLNDYFIFLTFLTCYVFLFYPLPIFPLSLHPVYISMSSYFSIFRLFFVHSLVLPRILFSFFINYETSYTIDIIPIHEVGKIYSTRFM